jgi:hypothetical protein
MKGLSAKGPQRRYRRRSKAGRLRSVAGRVGGIAKEWVSGMRKMHPNLVCPTGFKGAVEQRGKRLAAGVRKSFDQLPMRNGLPPGGTNRLTVAGMRVAPERNVDRTL